MAMTIREYLEPIAAWFDQWGTPKPIVHWGHPLMMATVVFVMGSYVAYAGWRSRIVSVPEVSQKYRIDHRKLAPWMFIFIALGYTGGVLSLVMQDQPIFASPHFWTGSVVLILLLTNALLALFGFGVAKSLRTVHAYIGSIAMILLIVHAALGLKLGLSI